MATRPRRLALTGGTADRTREALARLPTLSGPDLRAKWHGLYGSEAPARLGRDLLIAAVAYRLQERELGGLHPEMRRRLLAMAEAVESGSALSFTATLRPKPGTRLVREWQGRTHEVTVLVEGFSWHGTRYASLSQIARAITGTRWSGPLFFGLKRRAVAGARVGETGRG